jgi:O-antigen ligase
MDRAFTQTRWWQFDLLMLMAFVAGTGVLSGSGQMRLVGIGMVVALIAVHFKKTRRAVGFYQLPPELICYLLFVLWASVTGPLVAVSPIVFFDQLKTLLQMLVMVLTIYGLLRFKMMPNMVFIGLILASLIQGFVVITGRGLEEVKEISEEQSVGLTTNANTLGMIAAYGTLAALIVWRRRTLSPWMNRLAILAVLTANAYVVIASGSRKSGLILALAWILWGLFVLPRMKSLGRLLAPVIIVVLMATAAYFVLPVVMSDTVLGKRLIELKEKEGGGSITFGVLENERVNMYKEGWRMFLQSPIVGVGLGQFPFHYSRMSYSHSDIIEPLATTGVVGFMLYQGFYFIMLIRLRKLIHWARDEYERYRLKCMVLMIICILLYGLGGPHVLSLNTFVILATISAYSWTRLQEIKNGGRYPSTAYIATIDNAVDPSL